MSRVSLRRCPSSRLHQLGSSKFGKLAIERMQHMIALFCIGERNGIREIYVGTHILL
jgi:hypothetical protein